MTVVECIVNGEWIWPREWLQKYDKLRDIPVPTLIEGVADRIVWMGINGKEDKFSIRSVWERFKEDRNEVNWKDVVWFSQCNPRNAFILWLSLHGRLATQDRIMMWNSQNNLKCPLCGSVNDSHEHLFFKCKYSEEIWNAIKDKLKRKNWDMDWRNVITMIASGKCGNNILSVLHRIVIATTVYYIWHERNQRLFEQNERNSKSLLNGIMESIKLQLLSLKVKKSVRYSSLQRMGNSNGNCIAQLDKGCLVLRRQFTLLVFLTGKA